MGKNRNEEKGQLSPIEEKTLEVVREFVASFGSSRAARGVSLDAVLDKDLGLGSLERVELFAQIEKSFEIRLSDRLVSEARTPRDLARLILRGIPQGSFKPAIKVGRGPAIGEASPPPAMASTLTEVLMHHAETEPDRPHIYLPQEEGEEQILTYGQLLDGAILTARGLVEQGLKPNDTVGIMLPTGTDFFYAFFGVLLAGGIPVPLYPPVRMDQIEEYSRRQSAILRRAEARILIISDIVSGLVRLLKPFVPSLKEAVPVDVLKASSASLPHFKLQGDHLSLIQFTSGSTSDPKGVPLTHQNILTNIRAIGEAAQVRPTDVFVSWLPLYHDMGLIGSWLGCLYYGIPIAILSPFAFLSRPERWLWAIHYHQATLSASPNFGFEFCIRKIEDRMIEGLDLHSWRIAFNGSEAVSPDTLFRFNRRFSKFGFRQETFLPVYGMAEASVALSFPPLGRPPRIDHVAREQFERQRIAVAVSPDDPSSLRFVSCGFPIPGHEIRIVDNEGKEIAERIEGNLEFRGPSVMKGYYRDPETTKTFLHEDWWGSGDLAYQADGEIFITGRKKDVIIKAGRNLYPEEIEEITGEMKGIRKGCVAAFGVSDPQLGTEQLVIVAESRIDQKDIQEQLAGEVMEKVGGTIGIRPEVVLIVPPGTVLKTSSGKLRRSACQEAYLRGKISHRRHAPWLQIAKLRAEGLWERVHRVIDKLGRIIYAGYVAVILLITVLPVWLAMVIVREKPGAVQLSHFWARIFLWLVGCPLRIEGIQNLEGKRPLVYVANHSSYLDSVVLMAALPPDFIFVAKEELLRVPIIRTAIKKGGHLTVNRLDFLQSVSDSRQIEEELRNGQSVLIFAEGTFSRARGLRPFRMGAFKVSAETGKPVCPVSIRGTREILRPERWLPKRGPIEVIIGKPVYSEGRDWETVTRLKDAIRLEIIRQSGEQPIDLVSAEIPAE